MAGSSNSSFIPKRGPATRKKNNPTHRIYVFSLVSYILMFSALLASGAVFLYGSYVDRLFTAEVQAFSEETGSFDELEMIRVAEFDGRLDQATAVFRGSYSLYSVFEALEKATAETVQLKDIEMKIEEPGGVLQISSTVVTDSFDSTLFQRDFYGEDLIFSSVKVEDVSSGAVAPGEEGEGYEEPTSDDEEGINEEDLYNFKLTLEVPFSEIPLREDNIFVEDELTIDSVFNTEFVGQDVTATGTTDSAEDSESVFIDNGQDL